LGKSWGAPNTHLLRPTHTGCSTKGKGPDSRKSVIDRKVGKHMQVVPRTEGNRKFEKIMREKVFAVGGGKQEKTGGRKHQSADSRDKGYKMNSRGSVGYHAEGFGRKAAEDDLGKGNCSIGNEGGVTSARGAIGSKHHPPENELCAGCRRIAKR